ncbi:PEP-CTERM sorting domain-containing protein [Pelomonas cellulosilytica]|uniref:PEP-CTERM sorting domain-containing protein n=1 Tax=Pelomonas cellulosilytica TaxID=2906762 RepID=A0ABS8XJJ1_9BURK|nr:PEP-CTERM sorting domain-containing protein [Pelomonas sp. P8]MCE4553029.1 PEP-CTERM sorting domain-containing protein [Pelomonas sp. P8]
MRPIATRTAAVLCAALCTSAAHAGLIRIDAKSASPSVFSDFSITYDDGIAGDGRFQFAELVSFTYLAVAHDATYSVLLVNPDVPDIMTTNYVSGMGTGQDWVFGTSAGTSGPVYVVAQSRFFYTETALPEPVPVPEPATLALVGAGLAVALRRRRPIAG